MKKVLVTLIALSLPAVALADSNRGVYVQADAGYASVNLKDNSGSATFDEKAKGFSPRLSVGYDFGDFRLGADYTHYKSLEENFSRGSFHSKIKLNSKVLAFQQSMTSIQIHLLSLMLVPV